VVSRNGFFREQLAGSFGLCYPNDRDQAAWSSIRRAGGARWASKSTASTTSSDRRT
jgi:hypothetical protein